MCAGFELFHILVELVNKMMDIEISMQDEGAVGYRHYLFVMFHHLRKTYIEQVQRFARDIVPLPQKMLIYEGINISICVELVRKYLRG